MCSSGLCCPASPLPGMGMDALFRGACSAYPGKKKQAMIPARVSEMSGSRAELVPANEFCAHGQSFFGEALYLLECNGPCTHRQSQEKEQRHHVKQQWFPPPRQSFRSLCRRLPRRSRSCAHGRARPPRPHALPFQVVPTRMGRAGITRLWTERPEVVPARTGRASAAFPRSRSAIPKIIMK